MAKRKKRRRVFDLRWSGYRNGWRLSERKARGNTTVLIRRKKHDAIQASAALCRRLLDAGQFCQLVVADRAGEFSFERTYGADPKRSVG